MNITRQAVAILGKSMSGEKVLEAFLKKRIA
jgi:hypothetical protein